MKSTCSLRSATWSESAEASRVSTRPATPALAAKAQAVLAKLGYTNVTIEVGDGSKGLPAHAPFDGIVVSAAAPDLPQALFEQLKEGGRLVVPVGPTEAQFLQLVTKKEGKPVLSEQIPCRFVPLIGEQGYRA